MTIIQRESQGFGPDVDVAPERVEDVLRALAAALRSYRLYEGSNAMVDRFVGLLRTKLSDLWNDLPELRLDIEESAIRWKGTSVFATTDVGSDLPFLFYRDGIREVTLLPGVEDVEVERVLSVLARAPSARQEEDDLITLLWQEDLTRLRYRAVELGVEGVDLPRGDGASASQPIDSSVVREEDHAPQFASTAAFEETLYFLDDAELRRLQEEIRREIERDLWRDILNALLDRLEDGTPDRQVRIIRILGELLPAALANGRFDRAAALLQELSALASRSDTLSETAAADVRRLIDSIGSEESIQQLATLLEADPAMLADGAVAHLFIFFPPTSIAALMRVAESVEQPAVRRLFASSLQRLAEGNRAYVVELLRDADEAVVLSALRWIGRLEVGSAAGEVTRFLRHPSPARRLAALETLRALGAAASGNAIIPLLEDEDRDVRIAAARTIGSLMFGPGRAVLEPLLTGKRLREVDRAEKLAFFEAFGMLASADDVPVLDRILNGRSFLSRGEPTEIRACAAIALGKVRHHTAREALSRATNDSDAVVRTAAARALRGESS